MTKLIPGTILQSKNYGDFKVISDDSSRSVLIEFIKTGYRNIVQRGDAKRGVVKDVFLPTVYGVGFVGKGVRVKGKAYKTWVGMLERCYSDKCHQQHPTYTDCIVTPEWHNFRNFEKWFNENYSHGLHIDKDVKVKGNRVYGPNTCSFVSQAENSIEAHAKSWVFLSPSGEKHEIYNLNQFVRDQGLCQSSMSQVHSGKRNHHKGWMAASKDQQPILDI